MDDLDQILSNAITIHRHIVPILAQIKGCTEQEINDRLYKLAIKHNMPLERVKLMLSNHPQVLEIAKSFFGD